MQSGGEVRRVFGALGRSERARRARAWSRLWPCFSASIGGLRKGEARRTQLEAEARDLAELAAEIGERRTRARRKAFFERAAEVRALRDLTGNARTPGEVLGLTPRKRRRCGE